MKKIIPSMIGLAAFGCIGAPAALAASWAPGNNETVEAPKVIFTETDTGAAMLACPSDGKLLVTLSDSNSDFAGRMKKSAQYHRGVDVALTVGDETNAEWTWRYLPAIDSIYSDSHSQAAKVYNAVVRGDNVSVTVDDKAYVDLDLPGIDDVFRAFTRTCFQPG